MLYILRMIHRRFGAWRCKFVLTARFRCWRRCRLVRKFRSLTEKLLAKGRLQCGWIPEDPQQLLENSETRLKAVVRMVSQRLSKNAEEKNPSYFWPKNIKQTNNKSIIFEKKILTLYLTLLHSYKHFPTSSGEVNYHRCIQGFVFRYDAEVPDLVYENQHVALLTSCLRDACSCTLDK